MNRVAVWLALVAVGSVAGVWLGEAIADAVLG